MLHKFSRTFSTNQQALIGPAVRLLLNDYQIDPKSLTPTGPKNNVLKNDVIHFITKSKLSPVSVSPPLPTINLVQTSSSPVKNDLGHTSKKRRRRGEQHQDLPLTNMRSIIAKRLFEAKSSIPHNYTSIIVPSLNLTQFRRQLVKNGIKVSLNDFVIKAAAMALRTVPQINVQWKDEIVYVPQVDISVAVATPIGLITPIVFQADSLTVTNISKTIKELSTRAKINKLQPHEFQGGSFTVSNLGMFGIQEFTAIINPPQAAILSVGGTEASINSNLDFIEQFSLTLCYDTRAIDDIYAHRFLSQIKNLLCSPEMALNPLSNDGLNSIFDL